MWEEVYFKKWQETSCCIGRWIVFIGVLTDSEYMVDIGFGPQHTGGINNLFWSLFSLRVGLSVLNCGVSAALLHLSGCSSCVELREPSRAEGARAELPSGWLSCWEARPLRTKVEASPGILYGGQPAGGTLGGCPPPPAVPLDGSIDCALAQAAPRRARFSLVKHQPGKRLMAMQMCL